MRMIECDKQRFDEFLAHYPRKLEVDTTGMSEPPMRTWNDFVLAPKWPESIVAMMTVEDEPKYQVADMRNDAGQPII